MGWLLFSTNIKRTVTWFKLKNALAISFHPFLHPHPAPRVMFKTHRCCRSLSCQIELRWGSMYRHCRRNTSSRFIVIAKLSCHTSFNTIERERNQPAYNNISLSVSLWFFLYTLCTICTTQELCWSIYLFPYFQFISIYPGRTEDSFSVLCHKAILYSAINQLKSQYRLPSFLNNIM